MNRISTINSLLCVGIGVALLAIGWAVLAAARRKGKARVFWMSRVGPGVMFGGIATIVLGLVALIRGS